MNRLNMALATTALRRFAQRSCVGFLSYGRCVCLSLAALLLALPAVAQLATPIPATIVTDLSERHATLRNAQEAYQLYAVSRTEQASTLRQQEETASSGLRLLELPAVEYRQLPESQLWGEWITTASGERAWRGTLQLEESGWNTLYFGDYQLSRGDMLIIANEAGEVRGAFTEATMSPPIASRLLRSTASV